LVHLSELSLDARITLTTADELPPRIEPFHPYHHRQPDRSRPGAGRNDLLELIAERRTLIDRPQPFQEVVRERFQKGNRLVLLCAVGIAVRTLAPVLRDKYHDPAVLGAGRTRAVCRADLCPATKGGANEWARQVAEFLGAQAVITGAQRYTQPMLVAGLGCNRGCPLEPLLALLDQTLTDHGLRRSDLSALASIELKRDETGLHELAAELSLPIAFYSAMVLNDYSDRLSRKSEIVFRETGCYGVAEAAALAHAERLISHDFQAELIIPKQKNADATLAVARIYGNRDT
jgi:cobalt-precorrin 5A hydrolase